MGAVLCQHKLNITSQKLVQVIGLMGVVEQHKQNISIQKRYGHHHISIAVYT